MQLVDSILRSVVYMVVKQHVAILKGWFFATDSSEVQQKSDALLMPVIISEKSRKFESRQRTILGKVSDKTRSF